MQRLLLSFKKMEVVVKQVMNTSVPFDDQSLPSMPYS